ncbi:3-hydroxyacyl-CoA dehydrogenase NAD-binding domain-containing protein [Streptomyces sp. NPDC102364]|uniref:3-hydroxyacyl-CoA dehydrogenase NAD-binding domain-containing protein n=1 Tax=Streptomyces sp. NPDC102364 TaxID=3366161 RepID=UPI0037F2A57A
MTDTEHTEATQCIDVVVVGAGRMGQGIARAFLAAGMDVTLADVKEADEDRAPYRKAVEQQVLERLRADADADSGRPPQLVVCGRESAVAQLADADVVFEAVPEVIDVKRDILSWVDAHVADDAVIASTTSTFLVTEIADLVDDPSRVLNAHWLNPADLMPLVEVSRSDRTDPAQVERMTGLLRRIGKIPVVCGPAVGYIVPRLQALVMNEAARMVEEGVATATDIDLAVRAGLGTRFSVLGPLEFIDWGGGDILYYASRYLTAQLGDRFRAPAVVEDNMATHRRGLQDHTGFYEYDPENIAAYQAGRMREFEALLRLRGPELRAEPVLSERPVPPPDTDR